MFQMTVYDGDICCLDPIALVICWCKGLYEVVSLKQRYEVIRRIFLPNRSRVEREKNVMER